MMQNSSPNGTDYKKEPDTELGAKHGTFSPDDGDLGQNAGGSNVFSNDTFINDTIIGQQVINTDSTHSSQDMTLSSSFALGRSATIGSVSSHADTPGISSAITIPQYTLTSVDTAAATYTTSILQTLGTPSTGNAIPSGSSRSSQGGSPSSSVVTIVVPIVVSTVLLISAAVICWMKRYKIQGVLIRWLYGSAEGVLFEPYTLIRSPRLTTVSRFNNKQGSESIDSSSLPSAVVESTDGSTSTSTHDTEAGLREKEMVLPSTRMTLNTVMSGLEDRPARSSRRIAGEQLSIMSRTITPMGENTDIDSVALDRRQERIARVRTRVDGVAVGNGQSTAAETAESLPMYSEIMANIIVNS